jgi:hypothetical protein
MGGQVCLRVSMPNPDSRLVSFAFGLLGILVCFLSACESNRSEMTNVPVQITVQPDRSKGACIGDLCVTLRNRSAEDLVFRSYDLPWEVNAGGIDFVIHREDGSVVAKTPMIADPIVRMPALLKRGRELSQGMSLLVYYVDLPSELALRDLKVNWHYLPKPTNAVVTNALTGEFLLKKLTPSGEKRAPSTN